MRRFTVLMPPGFCSMDSQTWPSYVALKPFSVVCVNAGKFSVTALFPIALKVKEPNQAFELQSEIALSYASELRQAEPSNSSCRFNPIISEIFPGPLRPPRQQVSTSWRQFCSIPHRGKEERSLGQSGFFGIPRSSRW